MCKKLNGIYLYSLLARFSGRVLCFTLCIILLLLPSLSFATSPNLLLSNIEKRLQNIIIYSVKLENELINSQTISVEQQKLITKTLNELNGLKLRLEVSKNLSLVYKNQAVELMNTIEELEARLEQLLESFENTVQPLKEALTLVEKELRRQKIKTALLIILVGAVGVSTGYIINEIF